MKKRVLAFSIVLLAIAVAACSKPASKLSEKTHKELYLLTEQALASADYESACEAAMVMIDKFPENVDGYTMAATALLEISKANFAKINELLAKGCENAKEEAHVISDWVRDNKPDLAIVLPFIADYASPDDVNKVGISSGNMMNGEQSGGQVTSQGTRVYFASRNQGDVIYKMDAGGEGFEKLGDDPACFLNVVGDYIYYANKADDMRLYRIRTDGSDRVRITDDACEYVTVAGDWIYYSNLSDGNRVYKVRTDGSDRTRLSDRVSKYPSVWGDWVYFESRSDGDALWRVSIDGSEEHGLTDFETYAHCVSDDWVYYLTDRHGMVIDRMRLDGSEAGEVYRYDWKVSTFNVAGNRLFISCRDDRTMAETIVIYNMDRQEVEKVLDKVTGIICTGGEWLYYADWNEGDTWYRVNLGSWETQKMR